MLYVELRFLCFENYLQIKSEISRINEIEFDSGLYKFIFKVSRKFNQGHSGYFESGTVIKPSSWLSQYALICLSLSITYCRFNCSNKCCLSV